MPAAADNELAVRPEPDSCSAANSDAWSYGKTRHDPGNRMNGVCGTYRSDGRFCPRMSSAVPGAASAEAGGAELR